MNEDPNFRPNLPKLKDVVHFICAECEPRELGNVKLHKILYFADMLHYLNAGRPLTGVEYQKQQFGPVARHLSWAVNELCKEGRLRAQKRDYFGYKKTDYLADRESCGNISNIEREILMDVIDFVCSRSAKEISELSHQAPWEAAEMGETIPYCSAFGLLPKEVTRADVDNSIVIAKKIRPSIEQQINERRVFG